MNLSDQEKQDLIEMINLDLEQAYCDGYRDDWVERMEKLRNKLLEK